MSTEVVNGNDTPVGYQQITVLTSSVGLTVPANARFALIVPEAQAVRWRDDADPTASVGMPLAVGVLLTYTGNLKAIRFIEQTATAKINVSFYG